MTQYRSWDADPGARGLLEPFAWSRVVVVDDTEASATLTQKVLVRGGLRRVEKFLDPQAALDWITSHSPDLVLLDLHMPQMDGYEVLARIRRFASSTDLPVIVLTADATPHASHRAFELDANDFLTKPLDAVELTRRVRTMLDMRSAHRALRQRQRWVEAAEVFAAEVLADDLDEPIAVLAGRACALAEADLVATRAATGPSSSLGTMPTMVRRADGEPVVGAAGISEDLCRKVERHRSQVLVETTGAGGSAMALSMSWAKRVGGIVYLERESGKPPFTDADAEDAQFFVSRAAAALELMGRREERRRYLDFFEILVSQVGEYAIIGLDAHGRVTSWNVGAERVSGYVVNQVRGRSYEMFWTEEDVEDGLPARLLDEAAADGRVHHQGWAQRSGAERFWADVSITALHDTREGMIGFAVVIQDLTESRRLETARESFFASVSHDIQAPLTAIGGYAEMIPIAEPAQQEEFVDRVRSNVTRLGVMVDTMLDHARLRAGAVRLTLEPIDLSEAVRACIRDLGPIFADHEVEVTGPSVTVLGDQLALNRVLANLLVNAVKYSPVHSRIEVVVSEQGQAGCVTISDHGRGIAAHDLGSIFDEFERGENAESDGGSGIGLSSVQQLVSLQQGQVAIDSSAGTGTTVTVELPRAIPAQRSR